MFTVQNVLFMLFMLSAIASGSGFSSILLQIGPGSKQFKKTLGLQGIRRCFVKPTLNSKRLLLRNDRKLSPSIAIVT